ncbi:MAG: hypothetical protein MI861_21710, partial [Pirellulales bacterium]|nr:hypothetical protein [Pirellulales bacterium]
LPHHLGADFESILDGDLHLALVDRVCDENAPEGGLLLVIDEAQSLSAEVIEAIRMATNIMRDGEPRVFAVLMGGMKLEDILVEPALEPFTQRVSTRCYLHAMNGEETRDYVTETIRACGAEPENTVTAEAIAAIHHACSGVPRLINQIMTEAIDCAADAGTELITEQLVDRAWAQLQQLPSPMVEEPRLAHDAAPVEFGELGEGDSITVESEIVEEVDEYNVEPEQTSSASFTSKVEVEAAPVFDQVCQPAEFVDCIPRDTNADRFEFESNVVSEDLSVDEFLPAPARTSEVPVEEVRACEEEIFGEFDEEEEVTIGSAVAVSSPRDEAAPPDDLESTLHEEIIGISSVVSSGLQSYEDGTAETQSPDVSHIGFPQSQEEPERPFNGECDAEIDGKVTASVQPAIWVTEPSDNDPIQDDRDLLVIEEEMELARTDTIKKIDSHEQTISVDFQAMLRRMRSGA